MLRRRLSSSAAASRGNVKSGESGEEALAVEAFRWRIPRDEDGVGDEESDDGGGGGGGWRAVETWGGTKAAAGSIKLVFMVRGAAVGGGFGRSRE